MQVIDQLKAMSAERFLAIYSSLDQHGFGPLDGEVAKSLRFRPQAIRKLPMATRAKRAKQILETSGNSELTYELIGGYLLKNCKELVTEFLDATGVKHEDGMIEDVDASQPDKKKIKSVVAELDKKYAPDDVTLYLAICAEQWPTVTELQELWEARR
jgi:hypothetical protein